MWGISKYNAELSMIIFPTHFQNIMDILFGLYNPVAHLLYVITEIDENSAIF